MTLLVYWRKQQLEDKKYTGSLDDLNNLFVSNPVERATETTKLLLGMFAESLTHYRDILHSKGFTEDQITKLLVTTQTSLFQMVFNASKKQ